MEKRPILIFDLETTGTDVTKDRIVQIGIGIYSHDLSTCLLDPTAILINPEMPIHPDAAAVHGITDEMVKDAPTFSQIAGSLYTNNFVPCDIAGFNTNNFDVPLIINEFKRVGIVADFSGKRLLDAMTVYHKFFTRTLSDAYRSYTGGHEIKNAHDAKADITATYEVMKGQLSLHSKEIKDMDDYDILCGSQTRVDLAGKFHRDENGVITLAFGKNKGSEVHTPEAVSFMNWMLKADFSEETKSLCKKFISESETIKSKPAASNNPTNNSTLF